MPQGSTAERAPDAFVVGAGLCGLGVAARLQSAGLTVAVLERAQRSGAAWAGRYDALRLDTTARLSAQPGLTFPRAAGRWPARDDVLAYAARYIAHHRLDVRYGIEVCRIDPGDSRLSLHLADGDILGTPARSSSPPATTASPCCRPGRAWSPSRAGSSTPPRLPRRGLPRP